MNLYLCIEYRPPLWVDCAFSLKETKKTIYRYKNGSENGKSSMHSIYVNSNNGKFVTIPDHSDINDYLANAICDMLGIPRCCEN